MNAPLRAVHIQPLAPWLRDLYDGLADDVGQAITWVGDFPDNELVDAVRGSEVLITSKRSIDARVIEVARPTLRYVQVLGSAPWAVDWESADAAGLRVSVIPHLGAIAVAEHAMALLMGVSRRLTASHQGTIHGDYREHGLEPARTSERTIAYDWLKVGGIELVYGRTLGLVGLGDIGLEVAKRASAFGMRVLYHKRTRLPKAHEVMAGVTYASLDDLLAGSDVVSVHVPHTDSTEGLLDAAALALMKPTACLINVSRGGIIDEDALVHALESRQIAAAGLDVFVEEPLRHDHPLTTLDNVLLTPHTGGRAGTGQKGAATRVVANLARVAQGKDPDDLVVPGSTR